ncbi:MAG: hypothetical protein J7L47_06190 [Candidatus Odinarchaeota archaeon]|nr:hypothetical protein [Candidatus Odinarchaeota archaeon]
MEKETLISKNAELERKLEWLSSDERIRQLESKIKNLEKENEKLKEEITIKEGQIDEYKKREQDFEIAERIVEDYENSKLMSKELSDENEQLRKIIDSQAKELKFIKDTIIYELNRILEMDSVFDIKPAVKRLKDNLERKVDFEMEKYQKAF